MCLGPEFEQTLDDRLRQVGVFFQELDDAVGELGMVHGQRFHFVQRQQYFQQELLVFVLQWQRKAIDDAAEDFEQLGNAVVVFRFVNEPRHKYNLFE